MNNQPEQAMTPPCGILPQFQAHIEGVADAQIQHPGYG
jgi:hypothetical protein